MPRGQALGTPGANASGFFSYGQDLEELEERIEALEESGLGVGKKLKFGTLACEYVVKGFETSTTETVTGLSVISAVLLTPDGVNSVFKVFGTTGGTFGARAHSEAEEAAGTKQFAYWLAIGE
jgi:hypothetical protein